MIPALILLTASLFICSVFAAYTVHSARQLLIPEALLHGSLFSGFAWITLTIIGSM